ncbi:MAG TPA: ComF family protein [Noviherbaspirillum sp.]|nr:ComF family protein [Noviherbaspirillum sp.]
MLSRLRHWSQQVLPRLPAVLPCACALCGTYGGAHGSEALCQGCRAQFFGGHPHRCTCCALPLTTRSAAICGACLKKPPAFDETIVATDYSAPVDQLVLGLKFGSRLELAPLFAQMLENAAQDRRLTPLPQQMTAVPLGAQRLAERGFNQALEIARPLSRALGIKMDARLVVRLHETRAQSLLHPDERHKNIRNAFLVTGDAIERVRGQHIGVVDDVMTTGETLNELARTLKRFGAARVTNFVFARTLEK